MQDLFVFLNHDYPYELEKWEVGVFDVDPEGRKIVPMLGVRCENGKAWIDVRVLEQAIAKEREELGPEGLAKLLS